jgi:hypothetical protein
MDEHEEYERRQLQDYLEHPPYLGRSAFAHLQQVKLLCGEGGQRTFCRATKSWGTTCLFNLQQLLGAGVWQPLGLDQALNGQLMVAARAKRDADESAWVAQEAKRVKEVRKVKEQEAVEVKKWQKEAKAAQARQLKQCRDETAAREASKVKVDPEVGKLAVKLGISTHEAAQILSRPDLVPLKWQLDECHALGFTQEAIAHSKLMDMLGPRMTLSPHGRVLRWCEVLANAVRCDEKCRDIYFDRDALKTVVDARLAKFVAELNALGGKAHTPIKQGDQEAAEHDFERFYGTVHAR